ncbi:GntR family transcriptional regulator [Agrobacterium fabrum]|uniref:GntR family transcriptional regulator n=1 Tax=Agrobacterium fabrum TaxID=1176649 RepID=UPI002157377A|nr:GntR family transcriptional regulator [Agrobacterium fabrum]MCR6726809.1 GntR family transcriptional regulator [Agrobacterium fabrum]
MHIDWTIIDAIFCGWVRPGMRLGEQELATLFNVSRTVVRQSLTRLEASGLVQVKARRGWFIVEPSLEKATSAFQSRRAIESGFLNAIDNVDPVPISRLREYIARQREAIVSEDTVSRSHLRADFHVCLAEVLGFYPVLDILNDLTARSLLFEMLYQSTPDAACSRDDHESIVDLLGAGDYRGARAS